MLKLLNEALNYKKLFSIGFILVIVFLCLGKSSLEIEKITNIEESPKLPSTMFEHFGALSIFAIFNFLDVQDFLYAIEYFKISTAQQKCFPKFSLRKYGTLGAEYYLDDENGSKFLPSYVKQMAVFQVTPEKLPFSVILHENGDFDFKFSGKFDWKATSDKNALHGIESFFIRAAHKKSDPFIMIYPLYQNSLKNMFIFKFTPAVFDNSLYGEIWSGQVRNTYLFFSPSFYVNYYLHSRNLDLYLHRFIEGHTLEYIVCSYLNVDAANFVVNMDTNSEKIESILFMRRNRTIEQFFEENCQCNRPGIKSGNSYV